MIVGTAANEHGVAEAEEAILLLYRDLIGVQRVFTTAKGGNQHNQRAFGQMKIGNQRVDAPEVIAGINKNIRIAALRGQKTIFIGSGFQRAAAGCAHSNNPSACFFGSLRTEMGAAVRLSRTVM